MKTIFVAISAVLLWSLLSVISRILLVNLGLDPWNFSFLQLVAGGGVLLLAGWRGGHALSSFTRPSTWVLGALRVLSAALYTAVIASISVLEAGVIGAMNLPVVAVFVWGLTHRQPSGIAWAGHVIVILAVVLMAGRLEPGMRGLAVGLMLLNAICLAAMNLIAERHPENTGGTPAARIWFSGVVLAVTASLFLGARLIQGGHVTGMLDPALLLAGLGVGVFLRAPSMFLTFSAIKMAGAQSYTAAIALLPLFGMVFEQTSVWFGFLDVSRFQFANVCIAILALGGSLMVWSAKLPLR
ncbi:MAG: DMT family transporter [Pseudomonadota bacterium]